MSLMRALLQKPFDQVKALSEKGQPLEKARNVVMMKDTIVRTPLEATTGKVHLRDGLDTKRFISVLIIAMLPAILWGIYNIGFQKLSSVTGLASLPLIGELTAVQTGDATSILGSFLIGLYYFLPMVAVTYIAGGIVEMVFAVVRDHEINEGFLATGILIPLTLPPDMPLWMIAVGTVFGVFFGKEVFGGTGMNFLNPALTARAFLFFSYPTAISGDGVWRAIDFGKETLVSAYSGATSLLAASSMARENGAEIVSKMAEQGFSFSNMFIGIEPGSVGEVSALACLIGAAVLITTKVGSWRIMISSAIGALVTGWIFNAFASETSLAIFHMPAYFHLVMGGFAFGTIFMATDPVSAAATPKGQLIYGFLIGFLTVIIRAVNPAYPEGMMLAILFMNMMAPLMDHYVVGANIKRRLKRA